jgi:hypothetical protein
MNTNRENLILGLPRRPRGENQNTGTAVGALVGLILTENAGGAILGGIAGNALTNQPIPLESAVRNYFLQNNLSLIFFYRAPKSIEVLFKLYDQFWTVKSSVPNNSLNLKPEDVEDWLYGNLVKKELPKKLKQIQHSLKV